MADPGFPRVGGANSPGGHQHTILPNFPKNCMKLKAFGPPGGGGSKILLCRSATDDHYVFLPSTNEAWGKVMFLEASVSHSVHMVGWWKGGGLSTEWGLLTEARGSACNERSKLGMECRVCIFSLLL